MKRPSGSVPECISCGRCCFTALSEYIPVFEVDVDRMGERARSGVYEEGGVRWLRMKDGRCSFLEIDPTRGLYLCAIYEERPDACRALARASGQCISYAKANEAVAETALIELRRSK